MEEKEFNERLRAKAALEDMGEGAVARTKGITLEVLKGARNLVKYARVKERTEVALLATRSQDDDVVNAIVIAAEELGAHVTVIRTRGRSERRKFPGLIDEPTKVLQKALTGAHIIIHAGIDALYAFGMRHIDKEYMKIARAEYGAIFIRSELLNLETMASDFGSMPCDIIYEIGRKVLSIIKQGKTARVTTPLGTDINFEINTETICGSHDPLHMAGDMIGIPGGRVGLLPQKGYGILYVEAINPAVTPPKVFMTKPTKIVWDNNWAVEISGEGECTEWLVQMMETGDSNARWWGECMFGIHPKSNAFGYPNDPVDVYFTGMHSRPDTLHNALGHSACGTGVVSNRHIDTFIHNQTVYIDGEKLIDAGHLVVLDDPEVREFASHYGDPDQLLSLDPMPEDLFKCKGD